MSPDEYRRIALSLPGVSEGEHMDHPDFRVEGRIFATLYEGQGVVMLTAEQQRDVIAAHPALFEPVKGGWGRKGSTVVRLEAAEDEPVRGALSMAWRTSVDKKVRRAAQKEI